MNGSSSTDDLLLSTSAVTVREALKLALPASSRLLAGATGQDNVVSWASVLHLQIGVTAAVEEGELVLLATQRGLDTQDPTELLTSLLSELVGARVAAVALAADPGPGVLARADALGLPFIRLPDGTRLQDVERAVISLIVNRRAELEEKGVKIYRRLAQLVAANKGIGAIILALQEITGNVAALQDEAGALRFYAGNMGREAVEAALTKVFPRVESWLKTVPLVSTAPPIGGFALPEDIYCFVSPIVVDQRIGGLVTVLGPRADLTELDRVATGRAAAVCALEMAKQRAIAAAEDRLRSDLIADLLDGNFATEESAMRRAEQLGYRLVLPCTVIVCTLETMASSQGPAPSDLDFASLMISEVTRYEPRVLHYSANDRVIILHPLDGRQSMDSMKAEMEAARRAVAARFPTARISIGIGNPCSRLRDLQRSYQEAQQALGIAAGLLGGGRVAAFMDLGVYRLLLPLQGTRELAAFYEEVLGGLVAHDRHRRGELLNTLRAYLACHGNLSQTARTLYIHRNTLAYRIRRIEEITGLDLDDPEARLRLQLALKIHEIIPIHPAY